MTQEEQVERVRQAIMRYRELLDLLHNQLENSERRYASLFDQLTEEQRASLPEKLRQREAALWALADMEPLRRAVLRMRFSMRDMERDFEQIYNHIADDE